MTSYSNLYCKLQTPEPRMSPQGELQSQSEVESHVFAQPTNYHSCQSSSTTVNTSEARLLYDELLSEELFSLPPPFPKTAHRGDILSARRFLTFHPTKQHSAPESSIALRLIIYYLGFILLYGAILIGMTYAIVIAARWSGDRCWDMNGSAIYP